MRAFMSSDRDETLSDGIAGGFAAAAEREARRILAKIEPWREGGKDHKAWPPRWHMLGLRMKDDLPARNARLVLVDALRAFVEGD